MNIKILIEAKDYAVQIRQDLGFLGSDKKGV
jgi:hypothetical protein